MNILILEDSKERSERFRDNLQGHKVEITDDVTRCINLLYTYDWDAIFLDHDLGGRVLTPSNKESGYGVACWLEGNPDRQPKIIVIHSLNPLGVKRMRQALPESSYWPGVWSMPGALERILKHSEISW